LADDGWDNGAVSIGYRLAASPVLAGRPVPSAATIHRVLRRRGLVRDAPAKRPRSSWRSFVFPRTNDCWQMDGTDWALADGSTATVIEVFDDHSRRLLASLASRGETSAAAWAAWLAAVEVAGLPAMTLTDNGAAFSGACRGWQAAFERNLRLLGVRPVTSSPYHPQTCGKNERAHSTLKRWLRARPRAGTLAELQGQLDAYRRLYNEDRPHQALRGATPQHVWDAAADRAGPAPAPIPDDRPAAVADAKVSARGAVAVDGHEVGLGREWTHAVVTVIRRGDDVAVFHRDQLVRELTLDRDRRYQPTGKPRTGKRKRRVVSAMS
jgi:transposase InsO family protein